MYHKILCIFLVFSASPAIADQQLRRIENASETFVWNAAEFISSKIPSFEQVMPRVAWDDDWRTAAACILDGLADEKGRLWVMRFIATAEDFASEPITSAAMVRTAPSELRDPVVAQLAVGCGLAALALTRAAESGLMQAYTTTDLGSQIDALR